MDKCITELAAVLSMLLPFGAAVGAAVPAATRAVQVGGALVGIERVNAVLGAVGETLEERSGVREFFRESDRGAH